MPVPPPYPAPWVKIGSTDIGGHPDLAIDPVPALDLSRELWWLHQFWCARLEWKWCCGSLYWPASNLPWNSGEGDVITGVVENDDLTVTITCSGADWGGTGRNPWLPTGSTEATSPIPVWIPNGPEAYDAIIEVGPSDGTPNSLAHRMRALCDAARIVRASVKTRDSSTTVTVAAIGDYVTSKQLASIGELVGRRINFIKIGGEWPALRWPAWANAEVIDKGVVKRFTQNSVTIEHKNWPPDLFLPGEFGEWELLVRNAAGTLPSPLRPTVTPTGATGATPYAYSVSALDAAGESMKSVLGLTVTGFATLGGSNVNRITWPAVEHAAGYRVYGRTQGSQALIATLGDVTTYDDNGSTTGGSTPGGSPASINVADRRIPIKIPADGFSLSASDYDGTVWFDTIDDEAWRGIVGKQCVIIRAGERYRLGHERHKPWRFYSGAMSGWWAHGWAPSLEYGWLYRTMLPAGSVTWQEYDPDLLACRDYVHPAIGTAVDNDQWSDREEECGAWQKSEKCYSPHLFEAFRQIQADQEQDAGTAIEPTTSAHDGVPWMTIPILYRAAGVNAYTSTASGYDEEAGTVTIGAVDLPYTPIEVAWTVRVFNLAGDLASGTLNSRATLLSPGAFEVTIGTGLDPDKVNGAQVDITLGRTRFAPRQFYTMFPRTCRIPDMDPRPGAEGQILEDREIIDFEEYGTIGAGRWIKREPSTTYTSESGRAGGADEFEVGDLARWVSTGWNVPIDGPGAGADEPDPLLAYFDKFYDGAHPPDIQRPLVDGQLTGMTGRPLTGSSDRRLPKAAAESRYRFTDPTRDWLGDTWHRGGGNGYGHVESGIVDSGSTTTFTDGTKTAGEESGALWEADQFSGYDGPYQHFVIEFLLPTEVEIIDPATGKPVLDGDGNVQTEEMDVWHERVLTTTSIDEEGVHGEWAEPLHMSCSDCPWRIREPEYEVNRWQRRIVRFFPEVGEPFDLECLANGRNTIHLLTPHSVKIPEGTGYRIMHFKPGGVWQRATSAPEDSRPYVKQGSSAFWIAPRGNDAVRTGIPAEPDPFHVNQVENEPTHVRRFGRIQKDDQIRHFKLYNETVLIEDVFRWRKLGNTWTPREDPDVEEFNAKNSFEPNAFWTELQGAKDKADGTWPPGTEYPGFFGDQTESLGVPFATASTAWNTSDYSAGKLARYAYPKASGFSPYVPSVAVLWTYGAITTDDQDPVPTLFPTGGFLEFNSFGSPIAFRQWQEWTGNDFGPESTLADRQGTRIGDVTKPNGWPSVDADEFFDADPDDGLPPPFPSGNTNNATASWIVAASVVIVKYDGPNGRKMLITPGS